MTYFKSQIGDGIREMAHSAYGIRHRNFECGYLAKLEVG